MNHDNAPVAKAAMLIRKPGAEVFEAFVDPAITSRFWFTRGSARLQVGKRVTWYWDMYGIEVQVLVKAIEPGARILIEWGSADEVPTAVEWIFSERADGTTFVEITNSGFGGSADEIVSQALDSTGGFALVVAGLKAWLEHGIELNLVADRFPDHATGKEPKQ
jgi:uncharacterized protein YndB with AHSA1/START domain